MFKKLLAVLSLALAASAAAQVDDAPQSMISAWGYWTSSSGGQAVAGNPAYAFTVTSGGRIRFSARPSLQADDNMTMFPYLMLLDDAGNTVQENFFGFDRDITPGSYTIVVGNQNLGQTGPFYVNLFRMPVDDGTLNADGTPHHSLSASTLAVSAPNPSILTQPSNTTVNQGRALMLKTWSSLGARYQWTKNGANIVGANAYVYNNLAVTTSDAGTYQCLVTTNGVTVKSKAVTVTIGAKDVLPSNTWKQTKFYIAGWWDPRLTGDPAQDEASMVKFADAGFNLDLGHSPDVDPSSTFTKSGWYTFSSYKVSNTYRMDRWLAVKGVDFLAADDGFTGERMSYNSTAVTAAANQYKSNLTTSQRGILQGYLVGDEPWYNTLYQPNDNLVSIGDQVKKTEQLGLTDPAKMAFTNMLPHGTWITDCNGDPQLCWDTYAKMVHQYVQNTFTKVASYDHYLFAIRSDADPACNDPLYIHWSPTGVEDYFKHLKLYADETKSAKKNFWGGYGMSSQTPGFCTPTPAQLRYYASAQIAYGAKAMLWYTYENTVVTGEVIHSPSEVNQNPIGADLYNNLRTVNGVLKAHGPTLMNLDWIFTVHGNATDFDSKETGLPTSSSAGSVILKSQTISPYLAVSALHHRTAGEDYLIVFNKSIKVNAPSGSTPIKLVALGKVIPYVVQKTGTQALLTYSYDATNNRTTVTVATSLSSSRILPGDYKLIRLKKG